MFRPTAFAVVAALFGSLVVNLTLQPVLASSILTEGRVRQRRNPLTELINMKYRSILTKALGYKRLAVILVVLVLLGTAIAYGFLGTEFVPPLDEGAIMASRVMLPETSLEEPMKVGQRVEQIFLSFPEVISVSRTTGTAEASEHLHPVNHSHHNIELVPREERDRDFQEIIQAMRGELDKIPGVNYNFEQPIANKLAEMLTGTEGQLSIKLFGPDLHLSKRGTSNHF